MDFIKGITNDGLYLNAFHWNVLIKDICIVFVHGQAQSIMKNEFAINLAKNLRQDNIGFIYGVNRGSEYIQDFKTVDGSYKRIGSIYEIFEDSCFDIDLWVQKAYSFGYKKVILLGHSLGCNKAIYYNYKNKKCDGLILLSPPDMVGITKIEDNNYNLLLEEAINNVTKKLHNKLLSKLVCGEDLSSSENFLSLYSENSFSDNLPFERNPENYEQINNIHVPILALSCENEHETYKKKYLLQKQNEDITIKTFENGNHFYENIDNELYENIITWINKKINKKS